MSKSRNARESTLEENTEALRKLPGEVVEVGKQLALEAHDEALDLVESAGDQVSDFSTTLADRIRARPFRSVGVGIAIGCVLGLIVARR